MSPAMLHARTHANAQFVHNAVGMELKSFAGFYELRLQLPNLSVHLDQLRDILATHHYTDIKV